MVDTGPTLAKVGRIGPPDAWKFPQHSCGIFARVIQRCSRSACTEANPDRSILLSDFRTYRRRISSRSVGQTSIGPSRPKDDWQLWSPRVKTKLHELHASGHKIVIVTNQGGISKGNACGEPPATRQFPKQHVLIVVVLCGALP